MKHSGLGLLNDPHIMGVMQGSRTRQRRRRLDQLPDFLALDCFLV